MNKFILSLVAVAIVAGGGSFYGGMQYASMQASASRQQRFGQNGADGAANFRGPRGNASGVGGFTMGRILSKDADNIIVQLQDGGSKIILLSGSVQVSKFVDGTADALAVGKNVMINGSANSDGSITAQSIQVRPPQSSRSPSPSPVSN